MEGSSLCSLMIITEFSREKLRPQSAPGEIAQQTDPFGPSLVDLHSHKGTSGATWHSICCRALQNTRVRAARCQLIPYNYNALRNAACVHLKENKSAGDFHTEGSGGETNGPARRYYASTLPPITQRERERERLKIKLAEREKRHVHRGWKKMGAFLDHHAYALF